MGHTEDLRKSVEIALTFFIAILVSLLLFLSSSASHASYSNNVTIPASQLLVNQSALENGFWMAFFNSFEFTLLMVSIIIAWLSISISYLIRTRKTQFYSLMVAVISFSVSVLSSIFIILAYSNYLHYLYKIIILGTLISSLVTYLVLFYLKSKEVYDYTFKSSQQKPKVSRGW